MLIDLCRLNRPALKRFRQRLLQLIGVLSSSRDAEARQALIDLLSFPVELPDLSSLRPPAGNTREDGIGSSYCEQRRLGELPPVF